MTIKDHLKCTPRVGVFLVQVARYWCQNNLQSATDYPALAQGSRGKGRLTKKAQTNLHVHVR